jgi:hypothetical protein
MSFKPQVYIKLNLAVILAIRRDEMLLDQQRDVVLLLFLAISGYSSRTDIKP